MTDKGLISNNLILKWAEEMNRYFSKEDMQMANRYPRFNINTHAGTANQNQNKKPPHTCQSVHHQKEHK